MGLREVFKRKPAPIEPTDAQIARIAAKAARSIVARDANLLTPQAKATILRDISRAEQGDLIQAANTEMNRLLGKD